MPGKVSFMNLERYQELEIEVKGIIGESFAKAIPGLKEYAKVIPAAKCERYRYVFS